MTRLEYICNFFHLDKEPPQQKKTVMAIITQADVLQLL